MPRLRVFSLLSSFALAGVLAAETAARAGDGRLVLGTHDPALASALSVAVSPRGLSVVELSEPLSRVSELGSARRQIEVHDAVAVVWLCDDEARAHNLCFCGRDGRVVVRPVAVTSPLTPPDAAALALSVKVLLGPAQAAAPAPPPAPAAKVEPRPASPPPVPEPRSPSDLPTLTLEVRGGARIQASAPRLGARFGIAAAVAPGPLDGRLAFGLGVTAGPEQSVSDVSLRAFARGRARVRPIELDLDIGPGAHFLSVEAGGATTHRTQLSLDVLVGVVVPLGPYFAGLRAGGCYVPASPAAAPTLPRWNGDAFVILGANVL